MVTKGIYYPYGKENSFINELEKTDSMAPTEINEWMRKDASVTNEEIVYTADVNYVVGRILGAMHTVFVIGIGFAVYKIGKYVYKRIKTRKTEGK